MSIKVIIALYFCVLIVVSLLYVFSIIFYSHNPGAPHAVADAIPVFTDLIKVTIGAAIGAISVSVAK